MLYYCRRPLLCSADVTKGGDADADGDREDGAEGPEAFSESRAAGEYVI